MNKTNKTVLDDLSVILHDYWNESSADKTTITGTWAEDGSEYFFSVPDMLRSRIIRMQNMLCDMYLSCESKRQSYNQFVDAIERLFGKRGE